jgi:hypothetical protein
VQRFLLKTEVVEKFSRNRPSNFLKVKCREAAVRSRREASQVGEATKESRGEILFFISWVTQGRTDGRNHLRRFREVPRIVRSCRGARRLRREGPKGLKLRRGRAIDPESQEPSDLHVVSCIGDSLVEAPKVV